jgi:hypothetical protein
MPAASRAARWCCAQRIGSARRARARWPRPTRCGRAGSTALRGAAGARATRGCRGPCRGLDLASAARARCHWSHWISGGPWANGSRPCRRARRQPGGQRSCRTRRFRTVLARSRAGHAPPPSQRPGQARGAGRRPHPDGARELARELTPDGVCPETIRSSGPQCGDSCGRRVLRQQALGAVCSGNNPCIPALLIPA